MIAGLFVMHCAACWLVAVVGLCAYIVWERVTQRKGGWA